MIKVGALTPNYLIVNPDGTVSANFTGIISALGITLPAALTSAVAAPNEIQWVRQSDGALLARETAYANGPDGTWLAGATATSGATGSETILSAADDLGVNRAQLLVAQGSRGTQGSITVVINALRRVLLAQNSTSDYVQTSQVNSGVQSFVQLGNPFFETASGAAAAWPANFTDDPLKYFSVSVNIDPQNMLRNGSQYLCENTGIYLAMGGVTWAAGTDNAAASVAVQNLTSGYTIETAIATSSTLGSESASCVALIPANANDLLRLQFRTSWAATLEAAGNAGFASTYFGCMQIM